MTTQEKEYTLLLRTHGYRVTLGKLSLLETLAKSKRPLATQDIVHEMQGSLNQGTIYRALESLVNAGIVRRVDMQHAHAHYELAANRAHHHHLICKKCGRVEDIEQCDVTAIEKKVVKKSAAFASITEHSLEFFGLCKKCSA